MLTQKTIKNLRICEIRYRKSLISGLLSEMIDFVAFGMHGLKFK